MLTVGTQVENNQGRHSDLVVRKDKLKLALERKDFQPGRLQLGQGGDDKHCGEQARRHTKGTFCWIR